MAVTSQQIQELYIAYFNRPADYYGLTFQVNAANVTSIEQVAAGFANSAEFTETYAGQTNPQFVQSLYMNLFGRSADLDGLNFWVNLLETGVVTKGSIALEMLKGAINTEGQAQDRTTVDSKVAAAEAFYAELDTADEAAYYSGKDANMLAKQFLASVTSEESLAIAIAPAALATTISQVVDAGKPDPIVTSYVLTKGLDSLTGTAGNDTFIGAVDSTVGSELNTLSPIDIINGGAGIDTLRVAHAAGTITLGNLSNVEIVDVDSAATAGVTIDSSASTTLSNLNVLKSAGVVAATAAAATDIAVAVTENGTATAAAHTVNGGKNVNVTVADAGATANADTITVGGTTAATGNVNVTVAAKAYDAAAAAVSLGAITVTGGQTVNVTQSVGTSAAAATDAAATTVTQGNVIVNANAATTTVTVKQDAAVDAANAAASTTGVTETASVKFGALKTGATLAVNGLTLTAVTDLTAAEVAAAFSNLVGGPEVLAGDTQSAALFTKATYSGSADTNLWTSGAAQGDTVVFTATVPNTDVGNLVPVLVGATSVAPVVTTVDGKSITSTTVSGGVAGVVAGMVTVTGAGATALKTVTVDGYSATGSASTAVSAVLDTINLWNGGNFAVAAAAETLALNLKNVGTDAADAVLDLNNTATKTLNISSNGDNFASLDLVGATGTTALNVSGSGLLDASTGSLLGNVATIKVTETAGLDLGAALTTNVTSVDTTGTTGTVTVAISGTLSTYAGGAGVDNVTITNADTAISKAINLGGGDDSLDISTTTVAALTAALDGGEGSDTLVMRTTNAVALSANATFEGKISGFEKLSVDQAAVAGIVNLANIDDISYVISKNSAAASSPATKATFTATLSAGAGTGDEIEFNGASYTAGADLSANQLALQLAGLTYTDWTVKSVAGAAVTFEAKVAEARTVPVAADFVFTDDITTVNTLTVATNGTPGVATGAAGAALTLNNLANNGTLEFTDVGAGAIVNIANAATGTADVLNLVLNANGNVGTVTAANVETINVNALEDASTLTVAGNTATTTINVEGAGDVDLVLASTLTKLTSVNASTASGELFLDLSAHNGEIVTVQGGSGNDVLFASIGTNSHADVLLGGAGDDVLVGGGNGAKLTGGAGNDVFVLQAASKEVNTYSSITDFSAGDLLDLNVSGGANVVSFAKLTATLNETTSVFTNFVNAAAQQAATGAAVWFNFKGNAYVVVDNAETGGASADVFQNGADAVIELVGVDLTNTSYNTTLGTVGLI